MFEKIVRGETVAPMSDVGRDMLQALDDVRRAIPKKHATLDPVRGLIVFDRNRLYVVKPIGQRHWTQTSAMNDADEIAGTILMGAFTGGCMRNTGSLAEWVDLLDSQVPDILALVIDAWTNATTCAQCQGRSGLAEALCRMLRRARDRCDLPFRIDTQLVESHPAAGEDQGRMDIAFSPMVPRENIYFCLECKRINAKDESGVRPYFSEYVRFGMFRFVRGKYFERCPQRRYAGLCTDGDVAGAIIGVQDNIKRFRAALGMDAPGEFQISSVRPTDKRVRETTHRRGLNTESFVIHHVFVPGDPTVPMLPEPLVSTASGQRATKRKATRRGTR